MRILYVTTVGITMGFFKDLIKRLIAEGNVVDIATNEKDYPVPACYREWGVKIYHISTSRSPFALGNAKAIGQIRKIAKNYDIVHCHTPFAGLATRLACRPLRKKQGLKVIYTAHGFHFYKGAPKKNTLIYYPVEKMCSRLTDTLITITEEDYSLAKEKFYAGRVEYIPGVGVDTEKFANVPVDVKQKRKELGIEQDAFMLLSVGELNTNKNQQIVIRALKGLDIPRLKYVVVGVGDKQQALKELASDLGVCDKVTFLGYRNDVAEIYKAADAYILPSVREGLNVSMMEALSSGLPVICGDIRGNRDLVKDGVNGYLVNVADPADVANAIKKVAAGGLNDRKQYNEGLKRLFDINSVCEKTMALYR